MSASEAGYAQVRKSIATTITPLCAKATLVGRLFSRDPRHQHPPCTSSATGKGPCPRGLKMVARKGLSSWRRYSTSSMSTSCTSIADGIYPTVAAFFSARTAGQSFSKLLTSLTTRRGTGSRPATVYDSCARKGLVSCDASRTSCSISITRGSGPSCRLRALTSTMSLHRNCDEPSERSREPKRGLSQRSPSSASRCIVNGRSSSGM
mmetsp:Transcript_9558/g.28596  ORF Transcript_9558/g.28596 Transcript_9558/m.28596 type:complete len:207 (-) Transcript_9558:402-1022(-)